MRWSLAASNGVTLSYLISYISIFVNKIMGREIKNLWENRRNPVHFPGRLPDRLSTFWTISGCSQGARPLLQNAKGSGIQALRTVRKTVLI